MKKISEQMNPTAHVFMGGTCADSKWREALKPLLKKSYFDPVVDDWNEEAQEEELRQRQGCAVCLYVITPLMQGPYSVAEVVDDSNKRPEKTVLCVLDEDGGETWSVQNRKSLGMVERMVSDNGATVLKSLEEVAEHLNA